MLSIDCDPQYAMISRHLAQGVIQGQKSKGPVDAINCKDRIGCINDQVLWHPMAVYIHEQKSVQPKSVQVHGSDTAVFPVGGGHFVCL